MLTWLIQIILLSIIFIFLIHHLFCYMKNTLTIPKVKDLVTSPLKKYNDILSILLNKNIGSGTGAGTEDESTYKTDEFLGKALYTEIDLLPNNMDNSNPNPNSMKDELKKFLKTNLNTNDIQEYNYQFTFNSDQFSYL